MEGQWQTVSLPFSDFVPVFRARTVTDGTRLDPSQVSSVQLMLSKCALTPPQPFPAHRSSVEPLHRGSCFHGSAARVPDAAPMV